jgi:synaptojanin
MKAVACDLRYFWNFHLYKDFLDSKVDVRWCTPLIQGYVGIASETFGGKSITTALISRRSTQRSGTRFNARGIDDQGCAANFVETE